jgi:uncharacterized membrane protein YheB (UPF0754 family)
MEMPPLTLWITAPLLGAAIGYITNRIAVKMIFRPVKPVNVLGIKIQGLMPRRQKDLAESIGRVVGDHLVNHDDIVESLRSVDLEKLLASVLDEGLSPKIESLRSLPLIGGFLTTERVEELKQALMSGILSRRDKIYAKLEEAMERGLDVETLVADKVAAFPVLKLESLVLEVASRELRAIEILGGVLGFLIGIVQVLIVWAAG